MHAERSKNLENIMLSEINQAQKDKYSVIHTRYLQQSNSQEVISSDQGLWGRGEQGVTVSQLWKFSLEKDSGDGSTIMKMYKTSVISSLKNSLNGTFYIVYIFRYTQKKMTLLASNSFMSLMCFHTLNVLNYTVHLLLSLAFYLNSLCKTHLCHCM